MVVVTLCLKLDLGLRLGERGDSVSKNLERGFKTQCSLSTAWRPHSQSMTQQGKDVVSFSTACPAPQQWFLNDSRIH